MIDEVHELLQDPLLEDPSHFSTGGEFSLIRKVKQQYGSIVAMALLDFAHSRELIRKLNYVPPHKTRLPWDLIDDVFDAEAPNLSMGDIVKILQKVTGSSDGFFIDYEMSKPSISRVMIFGLYSMGRHSGRSVCFDHSDLSFITCPRLLGDYFNKMLHDIYGDKITIIENGVMVVHRHRDETTTGGQSALLLPENVYMEFLAKGENPMQNPMHRHAAHIGFLCRTKTKIQMEHLYTYIKM